MLANLKVEEVTYTFEWLEIQKKSLTLIERKIIIG